MECLYLLLITNKQSNILEDLSTLMLMSKIVQDACPASVSEDTVCRSMFDIVFSLDEVISFGYRESVTSAQVKMYTDMDSHEEVLSKLIESSKIAEARDMARRKQQELARARSHHHESKQGGGIFSTRLPGALTGGAVVSLNSLQSLVKDIPQTVVTSPVPPQIEIPASAKTKMPSKGLQLGKKKDALEVALSTTVETADAVQEAVPVDHLCVPVEVTIEEKFNAVMRADGSVDEIDIQGSLEAKVNDANKAGLASFKVTPEDKRFRFKCHPNLNKSLYANNILQVRDESRAFRAGTSAALVKYKNASADEALLPVTFVCWPTPTAEGVEVVIEFERVPEHTHQLEDVCLTMASPLNSKLTVSSCDGQHSFQKDNRGGDNRGGDSLVWSIATIDAENPSGSLEFKLRGEFSSLLPITICSKSMSTTCFIKVLSCAHMLSEESISFSSSTSTTYTYTIVNS
eukprot:GHVR01166802.1.p1 GENE.GHVR01166802.1~~GHVR01166802.1.p1  ORF type:complete len:460 (+),score=104.64 GHVR01166802.1:313-1692(+)